MLLLQNGKSQFIDANGLPLVGGSVGFYSPGTLNPLPTYQDQAGTIANTNPILLDSRGQAIIWGSGIYRQIVKDVFGVTIWDQIVASPDSAFTGSGGAALVGFDSTNLANILTTRLNRVVDSIAGLRALSKVLYTRAFVTGYYAPHDGGGGAYQYDPSDTNSSDNAGTIIVATDGGRWKLQYTGNLSVKQFGAKGDGTTDDTVAMNAAHATGNLIYYPASVYKFSTVSFVVGGIIGDGQSLTILNSSDLTSADLVTLTGTGSTTPALFRDFTIQASLTKTAGSALRFNASSGQLVFPNITNVQTLNVPTGVFFSNTAQFVIDQCNFVNYSVSGIHIENSNVSDSGDSSISNCFINTSVVTGSTYGIWHRSGGGLKINNTKILGGNSGYVMGWIGGNGAADLSIGNCSFESPISTGYGIFLGRDSGTGSIGSVMISNTEIGFPTCISTDTSGFMTLVSIDDNVLNIQGTTSAFFGISLNNVSNIAIGPNVINAQNAGSPIGVGISTSCSNGKIAPQVFTGMPAANRISNSSPTVNYYELSQTGVINGITMTGTYGPNFFTGTTAVTFLRPFSVAPTAVNINAQPTGGGFTALALNITTTGFTAQGFGVTNGGILTGYTFATQGGVL